MGPAQPWRERLIEGDIGPADDAVVRPADRLWLIPLLHVPPRACARQWSSLAGSLRKEKARVWGDARETALIWLRLSNRHVLLNHFNGDRLRTNDANRSMVRCC